MAIYVANNGQLQTIKGIYYGMSENYVNATLFHNLIPTTATEIKFLYASNNPDLTDYQRIGYCDNNNCIEVWNSGTKYILINPRGNYIYAPASCSLFLGNYTALANCIFNNFNTDNVTNMGGMFGYCSSLTTLDLSNFNTENVTNMDYMFGDCSSLTTLDLSNFNTENVTNMRSMFYDNNRLTTLDLSNFNTENVTNMRSMFGYCSSLTTIISNTFNTVALETSYLMFNNCTSLVGGNGTTFSSSHITAEYARVDGEDGLPGYFTAPN